VVFVRAVRVEGVGVLISRPFGRGLERSLKLKDDAREGVIGGVEIEDGRSVPKLKIGCGGGFAGTTAFVSVVA
jgi:hypothetical protein